jgi:hypothetical protein
VPATIITPQLVAAKHILIKTKMPTEGFEDQANNLRSLVHHARRPENPSRETAVRNPPPEEQLTLAAVAALHHACRKPSVIY